MTLVTASQLKLWQKGSYKNINPSVVRLVVVVVVRLVVVVVVVVVVDASELKLWHKQKYQKH